MRACRAPAGRRGSRENAERRRRPPAASPGGNHERRFVCSSCKPPVQGACRRLAPILDSRDAMTAVFPDIADGLLERLDVPGPRYTSYPTAPVWSEDVGAEAYAARLRAAGE